MEKSERAIEATQSLGQADTFILICREHGTMNLTLIGHGEIVANIGGCRCRPIRSVPALRRRWASAELNRNLQDQNRQRTDRQNRAEDGQSSDQKNSITSRTMQIGKTTAIFIPDIASLRRVSVL